MRILLHIVLLAAMGCGAHSGAAPPATASEPARVATFSCDDSLPRADGAPSKHAVCKIAEEYCYEASGGAAMSHGAQCRTLPKSAATCADLVALHGAGASCRGTRATGLRVEFAFP